MTLTKSVITAALLICAAAGKGLEEKAGPLEDKILDVPEGTAEPYPVFQFKSSKPDVTSYRVTGETDGKIAISNEGWLYLEKALDWAKQSSHRLQVEAQAGTETVDGPYAVTINVIDINNNRPAFNQTDYSGMVREHTPAGIPFMKVFATDLDNPDTPNAKLSYSIVSQIPDRLRKPFFNIDSATGEISTTPDGAQNLKARDSAVYAVGEGWGSPESLKKKFEEYCTPNNAIPYELNPFFTCVQHSELRRVTPTDDPDYTLIIKVEDLEGKSENAFSGNARVNVVVERNLWFAPAPVRITENLAASYPVEIARVQSNVPEAHYTLAQKERYLTFPFEIDTEGYIFLTGPLDREEKDMYVLVVFARDGQDVDIEEPLEIFVFVEDVNDNPPACDNEESVFEVQENEEIGSHIGDLMVHDGDEVSSPNAMLGYSILSQEPSKETMFVIDGFTGRIQLANTKLKRNEVPEYRLTVRVADNAGAGLSTECKVVIKVIDINNEIPVFEKNDYGELITAEDTPVGTTLLTILALDADDPGTGSSKVEYHIEEGDPEEVFAIQIDENTSEGKLYITKPLDFETKSTYTLRIDARNPEPLVKGVAYDNRSTTVVSVHVTDIDEPPQFSEDILQVQIAENVTVGAVLKEISAKDPEGKDIRFKLEGDTRGWLTINSETGEIKTKAKVDREEVEEYKVKVIAYEKQSPNQMAEKDLTILLLDVNDNVPTLMEKQSFVCVKKPEAIILHAVDGDAPPFGQPFTFSLPNKYVNWDLKQVDGASARLVLKNAPKEDKTFTLPITIKDNAGMGVAQKFEVRVCNCTQLGYCYMEPQTDNWKLGLSATLGILVGTLGFIGLMLICVFYRINKKNKKKKAPQGEAVAMLN